MINLHGKNLKGVALSVHLTKNGLVLIENNVSERFSWDEIVDIVFHDDKARIGRLDINLKKDDRTIMIVRIKEGKSLDKFLELADKYIEKASKKDVDKKVIIVTLLSGVLVGIFWLFGFYIGFVGILIGGYIIRTVAKDYQHEKLYEIATFVFGAVFLVVFLFLYNRVFI